MFQGLYKVLRMKVQKNKSYLWYQCHEWLANLFKLVENWHSDVYLLLLC